MWAGVLTALYVIVASVTGSLLMLHRVLTPDPPRADLARGDRPAGPDAAVQALKGALPGFRAASLAVPEQEGGAYSGFLLSRGQYAFAEIHPVTAQVTRLVTRDNSGWRFLEDLHNNLLSGRTGRIVNGVGGLSVSLLCITGILIWWPGRAGWNRGLQVDWRAGWPRRLWDLHGAIGIWLLPLTFVIATTGVYHTWPQWFRRPLAAVLPVSAPEQALRFADAEDQPPARAADLVASARAAVSDKRLHVLQLPADRTQAVRALLMAPDDHVQAFADAVLLHPTTARVIRVERYADRPAGDRAIRWLGVLHGGHFAGVLSEVVWFLTGLGMAALAATGLSVWWNRVVRVRLRRIRLSAAADVCSETAISS